MAPPKDIARSYPKRGITADVGFRSEPKFCGDGSAEFATGESAAGTYTNTLGDTLSMCCWVWNDEVKNAYYMDVGANSSKAQFSISYHNGTGAGINSRPYIWTGAALIIATQEMAAQEWHHLAVTAASGSGNIKIYLDGLDVTPSHSADVNITTNDIYLGKWIPDSGVFDGRMANAALFRTTLTQEQVRECMRASSFSQFDAISTLEAFYPLDANFNDSTSGGHNLTATGSPSFTLDRPQLPRGLDLVRGAAMARCFTGRAVLFDGSADHLDAAVYSNSSDFYSVSVWIKPDAIGANRNIVASGDTGDNAFLIFLLSTGVVYFYGNDTGGDYAIIHQTTLEAGRWYHLAMSVDQSDAASNTIKAYIDGVENTTSKSAQGWLGNSGALEIAARNSTTLFDGAIAGVKVFNSQLTAAQIQELYHNPEQVLPTGVSASNLRRYYPLSDYNDTGGTGGRYFQDIGADGAPAEDEGSSSMEFAQPVPCPQLGLQQSATRLYFPANVANYADFTLGSALGSSFTYATWVQPVNDNGQGLYCLFTSGASDQFSAYMLSAGTIQAGNTSNVTTTETVTLGDWTHIVITGDSSSPHAKIYINGSAATLSGTIDSAGMTETGIRLGMRGASSTANRQAHCIFAESAFWDVDLSPSEVSTLYNSGVMGFDTSSVQSSQLKAWHKYDDLATLKDFSGEGRDATVSGTFAAASFPENASGSTIVGDFSMKRKGVSILNLTGPDDGTAIIPAQEAVYPKAGSANGYTIGFCYRKIKDGTAQVWGNTGASSNDQFICFQQAGPSLRINLGDGSSRPAVTTSNITDSDWHHYSLTISYATTPAEVKIYVDGAVDHSSTQSITGPPALHPMQLGTGLFDGQGPVGCFKFYQVALSADEVKRLAFSDLRLIKGLNNE